MKIVSVSQMQAIEKAADASGISYQRMMENAGVAVADWIYEKFPAITNVVALVGSGNNGGDTLVALTRLSKWGIPTLAFIVKRRKSNDDLIDAYLKTSGSLVDISQAENLDYLCASLLPGTIVLDGIFGTGLKLPLRAPFNKLMGKISCLIKNCSESLVVAVDCPSGVDCDTGETSDETFFAQATLTMAAVKQGLLRHPARERAGMIQCVDIGIREISKYINDQLPEMISTDYVKERLPERPAAGHKGTFGTCLVIAGTSSYTGAAYLTGKAAYRAGCGLVHLGTTSIVHQSLSGKFIEAVWTILPDHAGFYFPDGYSILEDDLLQSESLVVGPGWGLHKNQAEFMVGLLGKIPEYLPTIFDADGLKLLCRIPEWWQLIPRASVLTPHPGEMALLTGLEVAEIQSERWNIAKKFARKWGVTLILKGAETVIADQDGKLWINPISDSALATAGSGDVLSGLLGGFLAQGLSEENASIVSTWLHAQSGIIAKEKLGTNRSVTALDILAAIPESISNRISV